MNTAGTFETSEAAIEQTIGNWARNPELLESAVVKNNPVAVAEHLEMDPTTPPATLIGLIRIMDHDEADELLRSIPWITGQDNTMDAALNTMMERMREAGGEGLEQMQSGTSRFIGLAVAALYSAVKGYGTLRDGKDAAKAADAAAQAEAQGTLDAKLQADAAARARMDKLKKAAPWIIAAVVLIILIIYKQTR